MHILDGNFGAQGHGAGLRVRIHGCELDLGAFGERKGVKSYLGRNSELRNKADVLQYNFCTPLDTKSNQNLARFGYPFLQGARAMRLLQIHCRHHQPTFLVSVWLTPPAHFSGVGLVDTTSSLSSGRSGLHDQLTFLASVWSTVNICLLSKKSARSSREDGREGMVLVKNGSGEAILPQQGGSCCRCQHIRPMSTHETIWPPSPSDMFSIRSESYEGIHQ